MQRPPAPLLVGDEYCLHPVAMQGGHQIDLLVDGAAAYPAMLEAIAQARQEVHLETYLWNSDTTGRLFASALADKAREGVSVRVVTDAIGAFGLGEPLRRMMRQAGCVLAEFHPVAPWRRRWGLTVRDHRKLLVIDRHTAFAGGLNIGDEYAPREAGGGGWHDVHARLQGPAVRDLQKLFLATWRYANDDPAAQPQADTKTPAAVGPGRVCVLALSKRRQRHQIRRHYYYAMKRAKRSIRIQAAYFVAERGLRRVLANAVARGVDVQLMLPRVSDVPAVHYAGQRSYTTLLGSGVRILEWLPSVLHAKTVVVDGTWCAIGSYNLDQRSLVYNWELTLAIADPAAGAQLEAIFEHDRQFCTEITAAEWKQRGLWQRVLERVFYVFRRWL